MDRHHRRKHLHHQRVKRDPQATITQIHYLTLKPTFTGPVAGYSTVKPGSGEEQTTVKPTIKPTSLPSKPQTTKLPATTNSPRPTKEVEEPETTNIPSPTKKSEEPKQETPTLKADTSAPRPTKTSSIVEEEEEEEEETQTIEVKTATSSKIETTSLTETISSSLGTNTFDSAVETSTSTTTSIASKDSSGSGGASIGGIIGGCVAAAFVLLLVAAIFYRKRKQRAMNEAYGKTEDEKAAGGDIVLAGAPSINEKPPRVPSLRPVTQFNPALNPPAASPIVKTGPSGGAAGHGIPRKPIPAPLALSKPPHSDMQPTTSNTVTIPAAPVMPAAQPSPTLSAFSDEFVPGTPVQAPVDATALVATGKPAPVYRVQMDYIPSQPDELEIRTGSLVRMLHEYDDGWALCVRMDRSHQGVCPRTCLSPRPVKPRPNPAPGSPASQQRRGPPPGNGRPPQGPIPMPGPIPQNSQARPQSPAGSQKYVPYPGSRPGTPSQQERPQTPQQQRPQTPQQQRPQTPQQRRPQTPQQQRPQTPQQQRPQTPRTPQQAQPLPQIMVTPTEPAFPEKPEQVTPFPEAPANPDPSVFHAL